MKVGDIVTYSNLNNKGKSAYAGFTGKCIQLSPDNTFVLKSETSYLCCPNTGYCDKNIKNIVIINGEYEIVTREKIISKENSNFLEKIKLAFFKCFFLHKEKI